MSTKVGDIFVRANLDDSKYKKGLSGLEKTTTSIGKKLGKALTVTAIVGGLTALINKVATLGDTVDKTSQKLGMSNKAYQEWDYIMQRNGASIESMTVAMKTLATSVETSKDALAELGITQEEALGLSQEQLFERVVTALQGVEDTTKRTYLASQLLGRGSTELGAVLNLTAEDMDNLKRRVQDLGGIMSDQAVKNSAQFKDAITDIKFAFRGMANTIAETVLPVLTNAINNVIIPAIQALSNALRFVFGFIGKFASATKGIFGKSVKKDADNASTSIGKVSDSIGGTGKSAKGAKKQVQALKRELLGFDKITKLTKETGTSSGGGTSGGSVGAIDFSSAEESTSTFASTMQDLLDSIEVPQALLDSVAHLRESLGNLFEIIKTAGQWAWENVLKPLAEWTINKLAPPLVETLASAVDLVCSALRLLWSIVEPLWNLLKPVFNFLGDVAIKAVEALGTAFGWIAEKLEQARQGIENFKSKFSWFNTSGADGKATISLSDKASSLLQTFKTKWESFKSGFKDKTASIGLNLKNTLSTAWNKLATKANNARKKYKFLKTILPEFPMLAQGGYVKANTPQLAMIGDNPREGEIVAPESKLRAMAYEASTAGNQQMITLLTQILNAINAKDTDIYLDGESIKRNTVRRINNHTRATGQLELII